jgi:hypothetical protein
MNIFYSEVDKNLQTELRARGESFRKRDTDSLNYMLTKIANVEITAYETTSSKSLRVATLGGNTVRTGRFMPTGPDGYLMSGKKYQQSELDFNETTGKVDLITKEKEDRSTRIGPFITAVDVSIGDHSMGLLNKASFNATIPNPDRDLDAFEEAWMRPGRYARIEIVHPSTAIASGAATNGLLTKLVIPNREKLKNLYPDWDILELEQEIREMRRFVFEGLITAFDFSYTKDGMVEVNINLTGTSNVYTNLSMYINPADPESTNATATAATVPATSSKEFYGRLYDRFESLIGQFKKADPAASRLTKFLIPYTDPTFAKSVTTSVNATDQFILKGEQFPALTKIKLSNSGTSIIKTPGASSTNDTRYVTLGALIQHINNYVLSKLSGAQIICTDVECFSVYYRLMVSSNPNEILFLPKNLNIEGSTSLLLTSPDDHNVYGTLIYYQDVLKQLTDNAVNTRVLKQKGQWKDWPGVYEKGPDGTGKLYPSRIFINLETIEAIVNNLSQKNSTAFSVNTFIEALCSKIADASGNAINLTLVTYPYDTSKLYLTDSKFVRTPADTSKVVAFSVPMFANHPHGTIVEDFQFSAKLPDSVKNLSYVLNSNADVSEEDIAPYLNFMYNGKNVDAVNRILAQYNGQHVQAVKELRDAKSKFGRSPDVPTIQAELNRALKKYIQYPTDDIKNTNLLTAPIFPFTVDFTIGGINGFRYGDVLTFDGLPRKYRVNTVFSVISINHTVSNQGEWKTKITCIQRPSIE